MTISITSPTSTTSKIQQNGNDVLTVDSSNNVTVTNNLSVSGTVTASGNINFDSNTLYVNTTNNRVGIGTSSPGSALDVQAVDGRSIIRFTATTGTNPVYNRASNTGGFLYVGRDGSAGTDFGAGAYASALWSTGAYPMVFGTNGTERMRIDSSGNVGIGTSSPSYTLDINRGGVGPVAKFTGSASAYIYAGSAAVYFGSDATVSNSFGADSVNNRLVMYTNNNERMRIDSGGNVQIGTTANLAGAKYTVYQDNASTSWAAFFRAQNAQGCVGITNTSGTAGYTAIGFYNNGTSFTQVGSIGVSGSTTAYNTSSDYRLKNNVTPMSGSIDRLKQLKPSTWSWVQDGSHGEGFIAHEAQEVVPEAITGTKDAMRVEEYEITPAVIDDDDNVVTEAVMGTREVPDYQGIDQSKLVHLLTAALQEAITKIEDLETRIATLEQP